MVYYDVIVLTVLSSFLLDSAEVKSGVRNKRVLYGHEAKNKHRDAYPIFRYYVYLAKAPPGEIDEEPSKISTFWSYIQKFFIPRGANLDYLHCAGNLVTPSIVQTACHCLATYSQKFKDDNYTYGRPVNVWENRIYSYLGSNAVRKMYDFLLPKHYVIYQSCRIIEYGLDATMMDYGFIVTKDSVDKRAPKAAISYTPVYRAKDILEFYYKTIQQEFMCLVVGHGDWIVELYPGDLPPAISTDASELQRWGWRTAMNYMDCLAVSYPPQERVPYFNYSRDATQVCLKAFTIKKKYDYNLGSGDSGGPVSCNDVFFAVAGTADDAGENIISYVSPIVHSIFINAADYRDGFIEFCQSWGPNNDFPLPTYPEFNPTPPQEGIHRASQCSLLNIHHHLLVLSSTLSFILTMKSPYQVLCMMSPYQVL